MPAPMHQIQEKNPTPRVQHIMVLRGSIKLLLAIGFIFLLVPFCKSLPWPKAGIPEGSVYLSAAEISQGSTRRVSFEDGSAVYVTRSSPEQRTALSAIPVAALWSPSAPGITAQAWWVIPAISAQDDDIQGSREADTRFFKTDSGHAWDLAGRALKPGILPGISAVKNQNLMPMPFKPYEDGILLLPVVSATASAEIR